MKTKLQDPKKKKTKINLDSLALIEPNAAGIDIAHREHWCAVPSDRCQKPVRPFGTFTEDLEKMADWFQECGIKTVAMESTGVYWIPAFQVLERRGFEVRLVNARHVKNVSGRKSDVLDCQWIQRLHSYGLLNASFRPADQMCVLRSYLRYRDELVCARSVQCQHQQKALQQMNVLCDEQIIGQLAQLPSRVDLKDKPVPPSKPGRSRLMDMVAGTDLREELYRCVGVDLTAIEGVGVLTAQVVISEIGLDMSRWRSEKHFASWLGLSPDNRISGGKVLTSHTRHVLSPVADALRIAVTSLQNSKTALGAFYRRMRAKLGAISAVTATAHKLARIIYRLLKHGELYVRQGMEDYERKYRERLLHNLKKTAATFGFDLTQKQQLPQSVS